MLEEPVSHSMTNGMLAANQGLPVIVALRIRSTGLSQPFEGAGKRISSILKSPSAPIALGAIALTELVHFALIAKEAL
jgi:hypothetical protein